MARKVEHCAYADAWLGNHIVGCWVSENFEPIPVLVSRGRNQIREFLPGAPRAAAYYAFVPQYLDAVEAALRSGGLWPDYLCDNAK